MRKIPVFYHIPKNAGTYVSDWLLIAFRHYRRNYTNWCGLNKEDRDTIKIIQLVQDENIIARLYVGDPNFYCDQQINGLKKISNNDFVLDYSYLTSFLFKNLFIFGVIIEDRGFKIKEECLSVFNTYKFHKFLILRDCFSRSQSMYNYITSDASKHEPTHKLITAKTFEEYILSDQLEDSWLIRNLVKIDDNISLTEQHFNNALEVLKEFKVYNIKNTDKAIQEAFQECYEFDVKQIEMRQWDVVTNNEVKYKKINIEELTSHAQEVFKHKTFWDNKLYNTLLQVNS